MLIAVAGASGFVGSHLVEELVARGHQVTALTRSPERYQGAGDAVRADVTDEASLDAALQGASVAVYLVHSLDRDDFEAEDARRALAFGAAAARADVGRIVYLGGLGAADTEQLSAHLRSRREVETLLGEAGVAVTTLRAAVVIGDGGISWEITRQLASKLPVMITPKWVDTSTQPIAIDDAVAYLAGVVEQPSTAGRTFEIGGPRALTYREMLLVAGREINGRKLPVVVLPVLTPHLSSLWISLVTDVDTTTARNLIESLDTEVVVTDDSIRDIIPIELTDYATSVRTALDRRRSRLSTADGS